MRTFCFLLLLLSEVSTVVMAENEFLNHTTYIVLDNDAESKYNSQLKYAITKYWSITKYKYISEAEFNEKHKGIPGNYFIGKVSDSYRFIQTSEIITDVKLEAFTFDKSAVSEENSLGIKKCGSTSNLYIYRKGETKSGKMKWERKFELDKYDFAFMIGYIQNSIQPSLKNIRHAGEPDETVNIFLHKKTLVMTQSEADLYGLDEEKIRKQYGEYAFKMVSKEQLDKIIDAKDSTIVYLRSEVVKRTDEDGMDVKWDKKDLRNIYMVDAATGFVLYDQYMTAMNFKVKGIKAYKKE